MLNFGSSKILISVISVISALKAKVPKLNRSGSAHVQCSCTKLATYVKFHQDFNGMSIFRNN